MAVAPVVAISCSSNYKLANQEYRAGNYHEAAAAYEQFLASDSASSGREARALYRLAVIHADLESDLHDPERVGALVDELRERFPDSKYRRRAELIKSLGIELSRLREELSSGEDAARSLAQSLRETSEDLSRVESELLDRDKRIVELGERVAGLEASIRQLTAQLEARATEVARLESELERMKLIDLESPP